MKYFLTDEGRTVTLKICGALDAFWSPMLTSVVNELVAGRRNVVVDLSALRLLDSVGVHVLVSLQERLRARHHSPRFQGVAAQPLFLLKLLHLDALFGLPQRALRSSATQPRPVSAVTVRASPLHDFIVANRSEIIERAQARVRERPAPQKSLETKLECGVALFLTQLVGALSVPDARTSAESRNETTTSQQIADSASLHGHELQRSGFSLAHVVYCYGDVCQVVTSLAGEAHAAISVDDFRIFNRCLDEALVAAITAHGSERERASASEAPVRLARSFDRLSALIQGSLAEVDLEAGLPSLASVSIVELLENEVGAAAQAEGRDVHWTTPLVDNDPAGNADRQLLVSAVSSVIQNASNFARIGGSVTLHPHD